MKGTEQFKAVIQAHLEGVASKDKRFAEKMASETKNIDDCVTYILNTVKKSGCQGFTDDEVFGMALHYYDEEKVDVGARIESGSVVVNHVVELTPEEIEEAKQKALEEVINQQKKKLQMKASKKVEPSAEVIQASLF